MQRRLFDYAAYYCEENVWHLCQRPEFGKGERRVVFISNLQRTCAMWGQRAARRNQPVIWDYHVIFIYTTDRCGVRGIAGGANSLQADAVSGDDTLSPGKQSEEWQVYDLDTTLECPVSVEDYLRHSFRPDQVPPDYRPHFRVLRADDYVNLFSSDRSHMKGPDGSWLAPPPKWNALFNGVNSNLMDLVDVSNPEPGDVLDFTGFERAFSCDLAEQRRR